MTDQKQQKKEVVGCQDKLQSKQTSACQQGASVKNQDRLDLLCFVISAWKNILIFIRGGSPIIYNPPNCLRGNS